MDIDKEEEALRSGIERSALALKSRLEQPLMKNDSMDSTETGPSSDSASACTTQPLGKHDFSKSGHYFCESEKKTKINPPGNLNVF